MRVLSPLPVVQGSSARPVLCPARLSTTFAGSTCAVPCISDSQRSRHPWLHLCCAHARLLLLLLSLARPVLCHAFQICSDLGIFGRTCAVPCQVIRSSFLFGPAWPESCQLNTPGFLFEEGRRLIWSVFCCWLSSDLKMRVSGCREYMTTTRGAG